MKSVSNGYKQNIKTFGKEIAVKITYTINGTTTILENEDINSANFFYEGNLLKSVMKQLELDSNTDIPLKTILTYQFGVKVNNQYEYITLGNFIVTDSEKQENTGSYILTCYDYLLYAMKDYESLGVTYPISVRNYLSAICTKLGITFGSSSSNFINYNQNITEEPYLDENGNSIGYTFRDVLDELAQITASTICINNSGQLEVRYINTTNETLDEDSLKNINVNFGELYEVDVDIDNQILNYMNRQTVLTNVYNKLNNVQYYLNDFDSFGITYLELCDSYNIQVGNTTYNCLMLNDEINVKDGLKESIYTEKPKDTSNEYTYVNDTDKAVRSATITLDQKIGEVDIRGKTINLTADDIAISSTNFSVSSDGTITATAGNIAGWQLRNVSGIRWLGTKIGTTDATYFLSSDGKTAYYNGVGNKDWYLYFKSKFGVTTDGEMYANNATISGKVTASSGAIGSWNIGDQTATGEKWGGTAVPNNTIASIYNTTGPALIQLKNGATGAGYCGMKSTDGSFLYAGASTSCNQSNDAKFKVSHTGALTSTSGTIGGFTIGNSHLQRTTANGDVGIGTDIYGNTPALFVEDNTGDYWAVVTPNGGYTNGTWSGASLEKYKKNFIKLENATDIIKNIDIYEYNLKQEKDTDKKHIGFVIGDKFNYSQKVTNKDNDGYDLYSFVSVCCKAIQEQQEEIELLKEEIKKLKKEN